MSTQIDPTLPPVEIIKPSFWERVAHIQQELNAPKNQFNKFGGYAYRSCEDILGAVKPLLGELILTLNDEVVTISDRYYIKATATLTDGTTQYSTSALAREAEVKKGMDEAQVTGSASSYARKYALNGLLAIDDGHDADGEDNSKKGVTPRKPAPAPTAPPVAQPVAQPRPPAHRSYGSPMLATAKQITAMQTILANWDGGKEEVYQTYGVDSLTKLTMTQASEVIKNYGNHGGY